MFLRSLILSYEHFITVQSEHKVKPSAYSIIHRKTLQNEPHRTFSTLFSMKLINVFRVQQYSQEDNRLLMHIGKFEQQMEYLTKLINIINVQNLTQVNFAVTFFLIVKSKNLHWS